MVYFYLKLWDDRSGRSILATTWNHGNFVPNGARRFTKRSL